MAGLVSENYAQALLDIAREENKVELYKGQLKNMQSVLRSSCDLRSVMLHPKIPKEDKKEIIKKLFQLDPYVQNFVEIIIDKNRFRYFDDICTEYTAAANETLDIEVAYITSAVRLEKGQVEAIKEMLHNKTGRRIETVEEVDPACIAGVRVRLKDMIIDNTVQTSLSHIKQGIAKTTL